MTNSSDDDFMNQIKSTRYIRQKKWNKKAKEIIYINLTEILNGLLEKLKNKKSLIKKQLFIQ